MEFTITKSESTQNSQISSLACENQCKSHVTAVIHTAGVQADH